MADVLNQTPDDFILRNAMTFSWILNGPVTLCVLSAGLIGNILSIIVLCNKNMKGSTYIFLFALSIWDIVVILCTLLVLTLPELLKNASQLMYLVPIVYPTALAAQTATIWITVSVTVERYVAICNPLKAASICTIKRARICMLVISILSVLYNIPRIFEVQIVHELVRSHNESAPHYQVKAHLNTSLAHNVIFRNIYYSWGYIPIMCGIPLLLLCTINTALIMAVRRSRQRRVAMNIAQSSDNNVTVMLIVVVLVFIVCQIPAMIYNVNNAMSSGNVQGVIWIYYMHNIRNFLATLNSSVNFVLYCVLGQKFRRTFLQIILRRKDLRHNHETVKLNAENEMHLLRKPLRNSSHENNRRIASNCV